MGHRLGCLLLDRASPLFPPQGHSRRDARDQRFARGEERRVHHIERNAATPAFLEQRGNILILHEAVKRLDLVKVASQVANLQPVRQRHRRNVARLERQQHDAFVEHLVVLEVVQQGVRDAPLRTGQEHGGARNAQRRTLGDAQDEKLRGHGLLVQAPEKDGAPALPGREQGERRGADGDGEPPALEDLECIR